jgi:proton-translocating NADH-quinone oxidoreductase chain M
LLYLYKLLIYYTDGLFLSIGFNYINIDGLSLILIYLTLVLYIISLGAVWFIRYNNLLLYFCISLIICLLLILFSTVNLLYFYISFESLLVPMFLIIGIWGSRERKILAAYRFWLYTIFGSFFFLVLIIYVYFVYGTLNIYELYLYNVFSLNFQKIGWSFLFIGFAVKFPIYPFHIWLPEAHVEAPTVGSILLAGILLKLGPYGVIRFCNFLFIYGLYYYRPVIFLLCLLSIYYSALSALSQIDIKKIIAYSSIGHMAFILLGIIINTIESLVGSLILMIGHGFVSAGLFFFIGSIYDRYKTRLIFYYKSLIRFNPKIAFFFFFFILANISFPSTVNFNTELFLLIGFFQYNSYLSLLCLNSLVLSLIYNLYLYSRIFFYKSGYYYILYNNDLTSRELVLGSILIIPIFLAGINFNFLIDYINKSIIFNIYSLYY